MHKIGKLFENGLKTTLCFSTSNLPNFYIFWVPNVVKKCQKKQQRGASLTPRGRKQRDLLDGNAVLPFGAGASLPERPHRLRPAGVSKASMTYIYLESQKHKNFWSNP